MTSALPQKDQSKNIKNLTIDTNDKESEQEHIAENLDETKEKNAKGKDDSKNNNDQMSIQPTPTASSGSDSANPLGGFKVPKKKNGTEGKQTGSGNEAGNISRIASIDNGNSMGNTPKLNKNIISNLNKSLKAKQKIISSKEPHPKNSTIISEIINNSPKASSFPNNESESENNSHTIPGNGISNPSNNLNNSSNININEQPSKQNANKDKSKRIAKQNSTRTDFFAAKLASAVDDVDTSDSDETFVYENNANDYDNNVSQNPNSRMTLPNDTASINGSIVNAGGIVTTLNSPPIKEEISDGGHTRAESIHSVHSSKIPTMRSTNNSIPPTDINALSEMFKPRPLQQRTGSSYSIPHLPPVIQNNEDRLHHPDTTSGKHNTIASTHSPVSPYAFQSKSPSNQGLVGTERPYSYRRSNSQQPNTATASINDGYNEDGYSYDEVDDTDIIDDDYAEDEYYSSNRVNDPSNPSQSNTLTGFNPHTNSNENVKEDVGNNRNNVNTSVTSKSTSKKNFKSSSSSSKLRSTTSKLFDKKGSQPRRYSIIPDDIDIEDFDDELIYYDNNIRFPYNNSNQTNLTNVNFNDSVPSINHNHRIPHYRSLNLNFLGKRNNNLKSKRYLSTGQPIEPSNNNDPNTPPSTSHAKQLNSDIFPFPYPEPHQKYYCDIDEYEESPLNGEFQDEEAQVRSPNTRNVSGRSKHPYLSTSNGHFLLPRKKSSQALKSQRVNYIKKFIYTLISISCILSVGFIMGFVLATTKELTNVSISNFENPIVSQDELIFNVIVEAFNPGWFTVSIDEVELDIFAKSGYLPENMNNRNVDLEGPETTSTVETVLLGTVTNLESPMIFTGGFFTRELTSQSGEIKLLRPGRNLTSLEFDKNRNESEPDNSDKWEIIAKNPFDLIVRGILKYNLPMSKMTKSVVVSKVGYIDPNQDTL